MQPMAPLFLTDFVPRFIWADKPNHLYWETYNNVLAPLLPGSIAGANVTPSIIGQYYLNWWWLGGFFSGFIMGSWAGIATNYFRAFNRSKTFTKLLVGSYILTFVFLSFRVFSANYVTYLLVTVVLSSVLAKQLKGKSG